MDQALHPGAVSYTHLDVYKRQVLEPPHPLRFSVTEGAEVRSLYATSAGKAFLSTLSAAALKKQLQTAELKRMTDKTITSKPKLLVDIAESKARGWFVNREESLTGVVLSLIHICRLRQARTE